MEKICWADSLSENMTEEKILRKKSWDTTSHVDNNKIKSKTMKIKIYNELLLGTVTYNYGIPNRGGI